MTPISGIGARSMMSPPRRSMPIRRRVTSLRPTGGRELDELLTIFPQVNLFERVVAENGALLYRPASKEEKRLGEPPPERFLDELRRRGVTPFSVGRVIVATWQPHENTVLSAIRDLGLELQVIFKKRMQNRAQCRCRHRTHALKTGAAKCANR